MISEYKESCKQTAQIIPNWKDIDKNELCRLYIKETDEYLSNGYLAAILYDFWNVTESNYYKQKYKIATEGDCIDWTVTGILYALKHHVWDDPNNSLYQDPKGPEKAINVCIYSTKVNFYQKIKHHKEKAQYEALSLEQLLEDSSDGYYTPVVDEDCTVENYFVSLIKESFNNKEYFKAFILDAVLNNDVFENDNGYVVYNDKKLRKILKNMDIKYCERFSNQYCISLEDVLQSIQYIINISSDKLKEKTDTIFSQLKHDNNLISYLVR